MRHLFRQISVLLLCTALFFLTSCGGKEEIKALSYDLSEKPQTIDPQFASGSSAYTIIENAFEGLTRLDDAGEPFGACAERWEVSLDGLTYTFTLKDGLTYAAAKGALKMLTKNIASEYGEYNIQCNGIGPGYIATPQTAPLRERQPDGSRHPFDSFIVAKTPAGRWGEAEDLGGPAVFLASAASDFVNGLILYVDGGILAYIGKQPQ